MRKKINQQGFKGALTALLATSVFAAASSALACDPSYVENFDLMRTPLLPAGWVASQGVNVTGAPFWVTSTVTPHTEPNDAFSTAPDNILDNRLDTPALPTGPFDNAVFFQNNYNLEYGFDGAVLEVSCPNINGGAFTDITDPAVGGFINPGYNATISTAFQSPIAGRMAWSGNSGGYVGTFVYLGNAASANCFGSRLRFRMASDNSGASAGWRIDSFVLLHNECPSPTPSPSATPTATATATPIATPCGSPNVIADSTFEVGVPWADWTVQTSTNFGTPLCNTAACGTGGGTAPPYAGDNWAWFGGANTVETATLGQSVSIMAGGQATLSFVMRIGKVSSPFTDVLNVRVDGTIVQSYPEPTQSEVAYSLRTIDLSAFANGASHIILFEYIGATTGMSSYVVDNVTLLTGGACPSPTPSPTVTPTATPTATATATATAIPTATATAAPTVTPIPTPSPTPTPTPSAAQALNISTRLRVETGDRVMIGGFIITGNAPKKVAIRGIGPSLSTFGLSDVLADPTLELRGSDGALLIQNDNWQDDAAQAAQLIVLGLALQDPRESGIVATLQPGAYTALMAGKNQTSGIGLVEIYDADAATASQLANISTRGFVQTGDNVMIGGFILGHGSGSADVVVRGIGPSLSQFGLSNVLADPTLELRNSNGALLIANDNWQDDPVSAAQLIAHGLAPRDPFESGVFARLPPGAFTAILAGKNGGVGLGLVEVYNDVHTLIVTNTADSGPGSLRNTIAAASDGNTIQFAAALNGQTISLTSAELVIDKSITISGPGSSQLTVQRSTAGGTPVFRIFHVTPGHTVMIEGLTIKRGFANTSGGGVFNDQATLTLSYCVVEGHYSAGGSGGGIYNYGSSATLTIVNSIIRDNILRNGGGIGSGGIGAGIYSNGTLAISDSTVSGNIVGFYLDPPKFGGDGAGIYSDGALVISNSTVSGNTATRWAGGILSSGTLEITNSTISGNRAALAGGGVHNRGTLAISNSTVSGNSASYKRVEAGGGIFNHGLLIITNSSISGNAAYNGGGIYNSGTIQIGNSILNAGMPGANLVSDFGTFTSRGYNLSSDNGGGFLTATGDQINTNPMLGPLQNNGGLTFTHALLTGSPAINAGDPNFTPPPLYDQRGTPYVRIFNGRIDIGSFELQP